MKKKFPSEKLAANLIPEGWTVVEDVEPVCGLDVERLEFIGFLEKGDGDYIGGEEMRKRSVKLKGNLGLSDLKAVLAQQEKLPKEFRGKKYIAFPGTLLRDSGGVLGVPCLYWHDERWGLDFSWLDFWDDFDRLARCKSETGTLGTSALSDTLARLEKLEVEMERLKKVITF